MIEKELHQSMIAMVALTCNRLSDLELATLNLTAQLNQDPYGRIFDYEEVKILFTEQNGTRMHDETKDALTAIVMQRLT